MMMLATVEAAQAAALAHAAPRGIEALALGDAFGRHLAAPVTAALALPGWDLSVMDGYACTLATVRSGAAQIIGESAAGHPSTIDVSTCGTAVRISTGAVVPPGAELVVVQEDVVRDGARIGFDATRVGEPEPGRHIRVAGCDVGPGDEIARAGLRLGAAELALLGAAGIARVSVVTRPRVAILSTGDELIAIGAARRVGEVIATNGLMLACACREAGAIVVAERTVPDDPNALRHALADAVAMADLVITCGGASVGEHDHVRQAAAEPGFETLVWGIAMRPGKPTGIVRTRGGLWFALAGNPASTFVGCELFVRPALRRMQGVRGDPRRPLRVLRAEGVFEGERNREHWVRARTTGDAVAPLSDQRSGNLRSLAGADALVRVPAGCIRIEPGEPCQALVFDALAHERAP